MMCGELNLDIEPIIPPKLPYELDEKIFYPTNDEGEIIGEPYSYNDWVNKIKMISGVNEDLLGE